MHLQQMKLWESAVVLPFIHQPSGSVTPGRNLGSLHSFQCTNSFIYIYISPFWKLLLNDASYSSFTKNVSLNQDLSASNLDQTMRCRGQSQSWFLHYRNPFRYHQDGFNDPTLMQHSVEHPSHPRREEH